MPARLFSATLRIGSSSENAGELLATAMMEPLPAGDHGPSPSSLVARTCT